MFLLSLSHVNCLDMAALQVFRKCLFSYALHRVLRLAAASVKGHDHSECALVFTDVLPGSFGTKNEIQHIPSCPLMPFSCTKEKKIPVWNKREKEQVLD